MSINDCSTFDQPRPISSSVIESGQVTVGPCDFITFLAVAQRLQIDFLPITWQSTRQQIGIGGTSRIDEALMDIQTSFAFKRVAEEHKRDETENTIFQVLISEITVLRHPSIRAHINIVELQGICWDIPLKTEISHIKETATISLDKDKVWPVLVFEKSQFGDLYHFARLPVGRELGIDERIKLCLDIGTAVVDMHFNRKSHRSPLEQ
jgi:hypothetical protein